MLQIRDRDVNDLTVVRICNRSFIVTPMIGRFDAVFARRLRATRVGVGGGDQDARGRFVEQQEFGAQIGSRSIVGADFVRRSIRPERTARPPSLRSCADSARPAATISRMASCTRFS